MRPIIRAALFCAALFCTSCYLKERVSELLGKGPESAPQSRIVKGKNSTNMTTECCWCYLLSFRENEVNPYVRPELCENLESTRNAHCRKVRVLGNSCSFLNTTNRAALDCDVRPLKYIEEGKIRLIEPPNSDFGPCHQKSAETEDMATKRKVAGQDSRKCYWSCGRNQVKPEECVASLYHEGKIEKSESLRKPPGNDACDVSTCVELFGDKFYGLCPTFESGASEKAKP